MDYLSEIKLLLLLLLLLLLIAEYSFLYFSLYATSPDIAMHISSDTYIHMRSDRQSEICNISLVNKAT